MAGRRAVGSGIEWRVRGVNGPVDGDCMGNVGDAGSEGGGELRSPGLCCAGGAVAGRAVAGRAVAAGAVNGELLGESRDVVRRGRITCASDFDGGGGCCCAAAIAESGLSGCCCRCCCCCCCSSMFCWGSMRASVRASKLKGLLRSLEGGSGGRGESRSLTDAFGLYFGDGVISGVIVSTFIVGIGGAGLCACIIILASNLIDKKVGILTSRGREDSTELIQARGRGYGYIPARD